MQVKKIEFFCDICNQKKENHELIKANLPFITDCDWTEGGACKPTIEFEDVEICEECLMRSTNLHCGFRGMNKEIKMRGEE